MLSRFCLSETSCPQEDNYPNSLCIKVNGKLFPLPVSACFTPEQLSKKPVQLRHPATKILTKHFIPSGLCTTTKKWRGTEETRKTSKHYLPCPTFLRSTQSNFSDMGTWNWKSENINLIGTLFSFLFFLCLSWTLCLGAETVTCDSVWSYCFADLFYVCVSGEAADITTAPAKAENEGHQKPRPLQSAK